MGRLYPRAGRSQAERANTGTSNGPLVPTVGHYYRFKRGDRVAIISGRHEGATGVVESGVFQGTVDYPDEFAPAYHVVLDDARVATVRWDQVGGAFSNPCL